MFDCFIHQRLNSMARTALINVNVCKTFDLKNYSTLPKAELIEFIKVCKYNFR